MLVRLVQCCKMADKSRGGQDELSFLLLLDPRPSKVREQQPEDGSSGNVGTEDLVEMTEANINTKQKKTARRRRKKCPTQGKPRSMVQRISKHTEQRKKTSRQESCTV